MPGRKPIRLWRGLRRAITRKLIHALTSLNAEDAKETAKQVANPSYVPLYFGATPAIQAAVALLLATANANLVAKG